MEGKRWPRTSRFGWLVEQALMSEQFQGRIRRMVEETAPSLIESSARDAANSTVQHTVAQLIDDATRPLTENTHGVKPALTRSNLALVSSIIAIAAAVALPFVL